MIHRHLRTCRRGRNRINEIERAVCTVAICDIGDTHNRPAESGSGDGRTRTEEIKSYIARRKTRARAATQKEGIMRCPEHEIYEGADKTCDDDIQIPASHF